VRRLGECALPTRYGEFRLVAYQDMERAVHLALVRGEILAEEPVLIRVHVQDSLCDLTGALRRDCGWPVGNALERVAQEDTGMVLILRNEESDLELARRVRRYELEDQGQELPGYERKDDLRTYGLGAQILRDLGVRRMRVLSAPKRIHGLSGFGLEVVEYLG
jgi:3,4-dihydroxy 2-butanone 4-phosphate synthase / GTP cyclohydrolase II